MSRSKTKASWFSMKYRCQKPKNNKYHLYGGRGIKVCERWESFELFLQDMGERPDGHTLDRLDSNGNYEPSNCRWADSHTQCRNRRNNTILTFRGETRTVSDWADVLGFNRNTISKRIRAGWSLEVAFSREPVHGLRGNKV